MTVINNSRTRTIEAYIMPVEVPEKFLLKTTKNSFSS